MITRITKRSINKKPVSFVVSRSLLEEAQRRLDFREGIEQLLYVTGKVEADVRVAQTLWEVPTIASVAFVLDTTETLGILRQAERRGELLIGLWHCHPEFGLPLASWIDIKTHRALEAIYGGLLGAVFLDGVVRFYSTIPFKVFLEEDGELQEVNHVLQFEGLRGC